jgi:Ca2+-binding EF-hand superfamily protein
MNWSRLLVASMCLLLGAVVTAPAQERPKQRPKEAPKAFDPARLLEQYDKNKDGFLEKSELPERLQQRFEQMDLNNDGKLNREELTKVAQRIGKQPQARPGAAPDLLFGLLDSNKDGKLSKEELENASKLLEKLDKNKNGMIDREELAVPPKKRPGRPGEVITPAAKGERLPDKLKVGDVAPDFDLPLVSGKGEVALSRLTPGRPVVLIFASYT